jgi:hypothetical protein
MRRALALTSVAVTVGVFALAAACSDSDPGSTFKDNPDGGDPFDGGLFNLDGSSKGPDGGAVNCDPHLPTNFAPVWTAPTKKNACTTDELAGYYDACAGNLKDTKCLTWIADHKTCSDCVEVADGSGPIQPHRERLFQTLNVAGCVSLAGKDTCAKAYDALFQCERLSCEDCLGQAGADFATFTRCEKSAESSACADLNTKEGTACTGVKDPDGGVPSCFPTASEDADLKSGVSDKVAAANRSYFLRVEGIFCGP